MYTINGRVEPKQCRPIGFCGVILAVPPIANRSEWACRDKHCRLIGDLFPTCLPQIRSTDWLCCTRDVANPIMLPVGHRARERRLRHLLQGAHFATNRQSFKLAIGDNRKNDEYRIRPIIGRPLLCILQTHI